jgi:hypothetical protein
MKKGRICTRPVNECLLCKGCGAPTPAPRSALRYVGVAPPHASKGTLFAFIPVLPDGAFCEGG